MYDANALLYRGVFAFGIKANFQRNRIAGSIVFYEIMLNFGELRSWLAILKNGND